MMPTKALRRSWCMSRPGPAASAAFLVGMLVATVAAAAPAVTISHPWMRFLTLEIPAAGYFTLHNDGARPIVLSGAKSADCERLMLHQSVVTKGTAHMRMVHSVTVPPHGAISFQPGGYHLMCMTPSTAIAPGRKVPVSLQFQGGGSLSVLFPVYGAKGR